MTPTRDEWREYDQAGADPMTPTPEQIEAAKAEYTKAYVNLGGVGFACFLTSKEQDEAFNQAFKRLSVAAQAYVPMLEALTAAAGVGEHVTVLSAKDSEAFCKALDDPPAPSEKLKELMRTPHFWSGAEDVRLATIERCAQVAERIETEIIGLHGIAAAIRALKETSRR